MLFGRARVGGVGGPQFRGISGLTSCGLGTMEWALWEFEEFILGSGLNSIIGFVVSCNMGGGCLGHRGRGSWKL